MEADNKKNNFIGVFDSGVGGISVLRQIVKLMPDENIIYFGDSKNAPYGVKSVDEVCDLTFFHIKNFIEEGAKAICIACNTGTSAAAKKLRLAYPNLPLVGIEPAIKPAVEGKENSNILVMATPMTIKEEKFQCLLARFYGRANIYQLPCPGLMEYIEAGKVEGDELESFLLRLLSTYIDKSIDYIVLGCTHYPFAAKTLAKIMGDSVKIIDGSLGTAKELKRRIERTGLLRKKSKTPPYIIIRNSDPTKIELSQKLLNL